MGERCWDVWDEDRATYYADTYGKPNKPTPDHLRRMMIAKSLLLDGSVFDAGCGIGHLYHILPPNTEYVGVDSSRFMIDYAKRYADADFRVGDIFDLSGYGTYDNVVCQSVLVHLPDIENPIRELWNHAGKALIFSIQVSHHPKTTVWKQYKNKVILSHVDTWDNIMKIAASLEGYWRIDRIVDPDLYVNNYVRIWRK